MKLLSIKVARCKAAVMTAQIFIMIAPGVANQVFEAHDSKKVVFWKRRTKRVDVGVSVERVRLT
jgi:hypothetical protein